MQKIDREDMLELTRRMTVKRNCFHRITGAYLDADGFLDGTFNIHFQKLSLPDQEKNLKIAKAIPFSETNEELKLYHFSEEAKKPGNIWSVLMELRNCELKNDALLESFYEFVAEGRGGIMMDMAMNFDADECLVTAMFDKGNRNDTMEAIDHIIPFLKGDADMIGLVCNTIRKLFCMSDEGYEVFLMDLEEYKMELEEEEEE